MKSCEYLQARETIAQLATLSLASHKTASSQVVIFLQKSTIMLPWTAVLTLLTLRLRQTSI